MSDTTGGTEYARAMRPPRDYEAEFAAVTLERDAAREAEKVQTERVAEFRRQRDEAIAERDRLRGPASILTMLCHANGEPCDGFRFRELLIEMREAMGMPRDGLSAAEYGAWIAQPTTERK